MFTYLIHNIPDAFWGTILTYRIYHKMDVYNFVKRQGFFVNTFSSLFPQQLL